MANQILTISGTDASGKGSVSRIVQDRLREEGTSLRVISPPFYETPIGGEVKEYLTNGYKCWTDRKLASAMYSIDRNWWMRQHFDDVFLNPECKIALYNRNWLDSVLFQTTLIAQTPEDTERFIEISKRYFARYGGVESGTDLTMQDLHKIFECEIDPNDKRLNELATKVVYMTCENKEELRQFYLHNRYAIIRDHIRFLYYLEVEPYKVPVLPDGNVISTHPIHRKYVSWTVFTSAMRLCNIVLIPRREHAQQVIRENLLKRYNGDASQMDRNEVSLDYQEAVVENIEWIHEHYSDIVHTARLPECLAESWRRQDMVNKGIFDPLPHEAIRAFEFKIIYITTPDGQLRSLEDIADEVISKFKLSY